MNDTRDYYFGQKVAMEILAFNVNEKVRDIIVSHMFKDEVDYIKRQGMRSLIY